jgi:hypothetical protein
MYKYDFSQLRALNLHTSYDREHNKKLTCDNSDFFNVLISSIVLNGLDQSRPDEN